MVNCLALHFQITILMQHVTIKRIYAVYMADYIEFDCEKNQKFLKRWQWSGKKVCAWRKMHQHN